VTEAEARAALRAFVAVGEIEQWIAAQPWEAVPGGWKVLGELHGWRFQVRPSPAAQGDHVRARGGAGGLVRSALSPGPVGQPALIHRSAQHGSDRDTQVPRPLRSTLPTLADRARRSLRHGLEACAGLVVLAALPDLILERAQRLVGGAAHGAHQRGVVPQQGV
jgi:hypothetical protein